MIQSTPSLLINFLSETVLVPKLVVALMCVYSCTKPFTSYTVKYITHWFSQQFTPFIYVILLYEITANQQEEEEEKKSFTAPQWHSQRGKSYCHRLTEWVGLAEAKCLDGLILVYLDFAVIPPNEQLNQLWQGAVIVLCHWKVCRVIKPSEQDEMRHEISWHQPVFLAPSPCF